MGQENGRNDNPAIEVVRHLKQKFSPSLDGGYRIILIALAKVYRNDDRNIVDHAVKSVLLCEKDVHHLTEQQFLEAIRVVFPHDYPIVYPDQFNPFLIIHPDGTVLWMKQTPEPKPASPEPLTAPPE
jgi:hypothetical protein